MTSGPLVRGPLLVLLMAFAACSQPEPPRASSRPAPDDRSAPDRRPADRPRAESPAGSERRLEVTVKQVVDGDTLRVTGLATGSGLVRLTGINAPETGDGRTTLECFGREARQWLRDRAPSGTRLTLALDVGERDRFGRLLAYAYAADGAFLNAELVAGGYARTMSIRPNVRHAKELADLQRRARSDRLGLWAACRQ